MSRTVVVGASSGLGRCIGVGLARRGGQIALLARRRARIEAAAEEAGSGAVAIECDVTDEASCRSAFDQAAEALGGIDNIIYTPAISPMVRMVDTGADTWRRIFDTNVIGASLVTSAARYPVLPDVDSLGDVGLADTQTLLWRAVIAPAGMPADRLAKLKQVFSKAAQDPEFKKIALARGEQPWSVDTGDFDKYVRDEYATMGILADALKLTTQN